MKQFVVEVEAGLGPHRRVDEALRVAGMCQKAARAVLDRLGNELAIPAQQAVR